MENINPKKVEDGICEDEGNSSSKAENCFHNNYSEFDDEAILAMCDDEDDFSSIKSSTNEERNPFTFGMEGSTINISNSKDIHFGPKTIATTPTPLVNNSSSSSLIHHDIHTSCGSFDGLSMTSSATSLSSQFHNCVDLNDSKTAYDINSQDSRRFSEGLSNPIPSTFLINVNTPICESSGSNHNYQRKGEAFQVVDSGSKSLRKSVSSPVGDQCPSPTLSNTSSGQALQCIPRGNQLSSMHPPMSAAINNSSNVQMGTQIVYNYYISDIEQRTPHCSTGNLPEPTITSEPPKDFLIEFKEKLSSVYQKRTRSSPLPWHRGKQLIPINEYYTEPQIFAIDKCGNRTTETVNIISILNSETETRFLVEGEAGMGKTLLATKLAEEWAKGYHLQQFQILLLITLGDFKGSLQQYVREELLPSYFKSEKFEKVWEYCKTHERQILFVLDGYDEMERLDKGEIQNLIKSKDFPESKVVVTSRPNILQDWEKKIVVSGFGQIQIMEFIEKYFRAIGNDSCGQSLRKIIEKDDKYWKLAKRPLFCVLLCMLYITGEVGESLPERQSDVMLQIILCLIKWNRKNDGSSSIDFDSLPPEYEKPFYHFGKLCLNALKTEKSRFSDQEVQSVEGFGTKLKQLGFLFNDNESHALGERKFWKPVHQTFLEYLGAFYMTKHLINCRGCKECKGYDLVFQRSQEVLKFCVGILNNKAYKLLDGQRFPVLLTLPVTKILQLLKEAEPKSENCLAVAKLLDQNVVEISTSEVEFEGWSYILSQPFRRLKSLKIAWRIKSKSPDQESSFTEATEPRYRNFFEALKNNESINCIHVRAKQDGEPFTNENMSMFFTHLQSALLKKNLQELQIVEMKMKASGHLRKAIEGAACQQNKLRTLQDLRILKLHTFMQDEDLKGICDALAKCAPSLECLHLEGLEHGLSGFQSLVKLLKGNSNIRNLHLSMNQSLFVNVFGSGEGIKEDYAPVKMRTEHQRMNRTAGRRSKHAFSEHVKSQVVSSTDCENENELEHSPSHGRDSDSHILNRNDSKETCSISSGREVDPTKELAYLLEKLQFGNGQWNIEARHYWYLRKTISELRIPLPLCVSGEHKSVFHFLFSALPETHLKNLTLSQAGLYLTTPDLICLGDAIRKAPHLSTLNLQALDKVESYLPLLIGMGKSPALTSVNFTSSKVILNDVAFEVVCAALQNNTSLRNLSLGRWQFHLQNTKEALHHLSELLNSWQIVQLDLKQCVIETGDHSSIQSQPQTPSSPCTQPLNAFFSLPYESPSQPWRSLKTISLEGVELKEQAGLVRRGHLLLPGLTNFVNLTSLDLSISQARSLQVDNIAVRRFFGLIGSDMKQLIELKLDNWEFCLNSKDNGNDISSSLRSCRKLKKIQLERVNEIVGEPSSNQNGVSASSWCKLTFLHQLVTYTPSLEELSLCYYRVNNRPIDHDLASKLGTCLHDHWHHTPFFVKFFNLPPDVDKALYQSLKKPPCRVRRLSGPSLIKTFEVRCVLNIMKRPAR